MKVVICTGHGPEYANLAAITLPSVQAYCQRHGYFLMYDGQRTDKDACKIAMYQIAYAGGGMGPEDVFVWIDSDAVICNADRRIESIVYEHMPRHVHYLVGIDPNGLNTGVFIARFTPEANLFLTVATSISIASGWADQEGLLQTAIKSPHKEIYKEIPGKVFNCNLYKLKGWNFGEYGKYINEYEDGDFILHLAGCEEPTRTETLRKYANISEEDYDSMGVSRVRRMLA